MKNVIEVRRNTGHILIPPPKRRGCTAADLCSTKNLRLVVKRTGKSTPVAAYSALDQNGMWDFVIDDALRTQKPGQYMGILYCCDSPIHTITIRIPRGRPGAPLTMDMTHDMCEDLLDPECQVEDVACPTPCNREQPYRSVSCSTPCPTLGSGTTPAPPCGDCTIPCHPCNR